MSGPVACWERRDVGDGVLEDTLSYGVGTHFVNLVSEVAPAHVTVYSPSVYNSQMATKKAKARKRGQVINNVNRAGFTM